MQLGTLETAVEVGKGQGPDVLVLILEELRGIKNLLTHPMPVASSGIKDHESFTRFLADRERIVAGNARAPLPKGAMGCEACRIAYVATAWGTDEDKARKASGPPCLKCDLPENAKVSAVPGECAEHSPGTYHLLFLGSL